jgi:SAM-dependent methyltransferase
MLLVFLTIGGGLLAVSSLPMPALIRLITGVLSGVFILGLVYFTYLFFQFSRDGGDLQIRLRNLVLDYLPWNGKGKALDIGTGNGPLAIQIAKKHPESEVTGVDYWGKAWEYSQLACERNAVIEDVDERIQFKKANATKLPFEDGTFDVVTSHFVFHEVLDAPDKREVIREALRVLRPGGKFSFQDPFLNTKIYGEIPDLLETLRGWGIQEVRFQDTRESFHIPVLLRHPSVLGAIGILYGTK